MTGFCIHELITSVDHPHPWDGKRQIGLDPDVSVIITVTPAYAILVESSTQFAEYEPGKGITEKEGWGQISGKTLWIAEDTSAAQTLMNRTPRGNVESQHQVTEMWKPTTEVRANSLILLRDLLQRSAEWTESHILDRGLLRESGPWQDTNRDTVLEQGYEASGLSPQACCPRCTHKKATIISGVRERRDPHTPSKTELRKKDI